jgi:hypothetical protein
MQSRNIVVAVMVVALALGWFAWRTVASDHSNVASPVSGVGTDTKNAVSSQSGSADAASRVITFDANAAPGALAAITARGRDPVDARTARLQLLTALQARQSMAFAIHEAAASQDQAANTFLGELISFCLRNSTTTAKAQASASTYVPARLRAPSLKDSPQLFKESDERTRFQENNRSIQEVCRDFDAKAAEADAAATVEKLATSGSAYAALLSDISPRTNYRALTAEQFELVVRALSEQDIGTLTLLGQQAQAMINGAMLASSATTVPEARYFADTSGTLAWQLALCQLGAYCGADSVWARDACFKFGACAGDDFASAIRAALIRDGMDATLVDKQASAFLNAITSGDPTQLGMRRKKP